MKKLTLVTLATCILMPSVASARFYESKKECEVRYGAAIVGEIEGDVMTFEKSGFRITAYFVKDQCVGIAYKKSQAETQIVDDEIKTLLSANSRAKEWSLATKRRWQTSSNGQIINASYDSQRFTLHVGSQKYFDNLSHQHLLEKTQHLSGF